MTHNALREVAEIVRRESGIALRDTQLPALRAALARVERTLDAERLLAARADPVRGAVLVNRLIDEVTVKETFFLRHREELERLDWHQMAEAATHRGDGMVRVWSAACSSGEEPYSLAVLAGEALGASAPPVSILATDIAPSSLRRAEQAVYNARSVRKVPADMRARWFEPRPDGGLAVGEAARRMVRFVRHNLIRDPIPPPGERLFDAIVCRNVLIYFERDTQRRTIAALREALAPGGVLLLGAADRLGHGEGEPPEAPPPRSGRRIAPPPPQRPAAGLTAPPVAPRVAEPEGRREPAEETAVAAFGDGVRLLAGDAPAAAVGELRRALYLDPSLAVAAFQLGRAHEALQDEVAARRAYRRALLALGDAVGEEDADIALACRARLLALGERADDRPDRPDQPDHA